MITPGMHLSTHGNARLAALGRRYGHLTLTELTELHPHYGLKARFRCDCGGTRESYVTAVRVVAEQYKAKDKSGPGCLACKGRGR